MRRTKISKRRLSPVLLLLLICSLTACAGKKETAAPGGNETPAGGGLGNSGGENSEAAVQGDSGDKNPETAVPGGSGDSDISDNSNSESTETAAPGDLGDSGDSGGENPEAAAETDGAGGTLVAYFSHTGENYGVGVIEKGNTHIIADMIAEETGADLFEIRTVNPYPDIYDECTDVAKREQNENARPEILDPPENLDGYDTIFIGYPIWWGDLPMAVYTFLERYDFSGKTVVPFCTHEGSGLAGTEGSIEKTCSGAAVLDGLAIRGATAQNEPEEARTDVLEWLDGLGL